MGAQPQLPGARLQESLRGRRRSIRFAGGQESHLDDPRAGLAHSRLHHGAAQGGRTMSDMNRRDALKAFAMISAVNVLDVTAPQMERALRGVQALAETGEPDVQQSTYTPKFFNRHEWQTVRRLADYVIPRDARSGSATDA